MLDTLIGNKALRFIVVIFVMGLASYFASKLIDGVQSAANVG